MEATTPWTEITRSDAVALGAAAEVMASDGERYWNDATDRVLVGSPEVDAAGVQRWAWRMSRPSLPALLEVAGTDFDSLRARIVDRLGFGIVNIFFAASGICANGWCGGVYDPELAGYWWDDISGRDPRVRFYCSACTAEVDWLCRQETPTVTEAGRTYQLRWERYRQVAVWGALEHRHPQHVVFQLDNLRWGLGPQMSGARNTREKRLYHAAWRLIEPLIGSPGGTGATRRLVP